MKSLFEQLGGAYSVGADGNYYPDLTLPEEEMPCYGKYGMLRKAYLKDHRKGLYTALLLEGKLTAHLNEVDSMANDRMDVLVRQMQERQGINEELKSKDQMMWVGAMNNICNAAEEIILRELVYC